MGTIPVEDIFYAMLMLLPTIIIFDFLLIFKILIKYSFYTTPTVWFGLSEIAQIPNVKMYDGGMTHWTYDPNAVSDYYFFHFQL